MKFTPCNGCAHKPRCKADHLACPAFEMFVEDFERTNWIHQTRVPSKIIFQRLFGGWSAVA